jgi:hypothetical protein
MILIVLAGLCVLSVPLSGGKLSAITRVRLRGLWIPVLALAVQVVITTIAPSGSEPLHEAIHISTYAMLGLFLLANRRLPGVWVMTLGTLSNGLAIVLNGGIMPAARTAERIAGLRLGAGFHNSAPVAHPVALWLGDIIPWPGPLANVLSVGDCLVFAGTVYLLHRVCARADAEPTPLAHDLPLAAPALGTSPDGEL